MEREKEIDAIKESTLIEVSQENFDFLLRVAEGDYSKIDNAISYLRALHIHVKRLKHLITLIRRNL